MSVGLKTRADYPRVDAVIKSVQQSEDWDIATTVGDSYLYQLRAAHNVDIFEPFTAEQTVLNNYLGARRAGKRLCDYAWRLYAQSM